MVFKICLLELRKDKGTDYVLSWKSKGVYTSKIKPLYTYFLHNIKLSGFKVKIKFNKDPLAVEQNNYVTKIVNAYIVYDYTVYDYICQYICLLVNLIDSILRRGENYHPRVFLEECKYVVKKEDA